MSVVRTEQGSVSGSETDGVHAFLGIPYAAPPVGELRWQPPAPPSAWDGVRDATRFGNAAIQSVNTGLDIGAPQSEDCLNLNVWTTAPDAAEKRPVMVWIHGGGFLNGSASLKMWTGEALSRTGVTVVSLNYRLGAFGFLTDEGVGANFGVQDWVAALRWVQANIAAFGGDPDNVTIFGQSAGGAATRALLSTPSARRLFSRAVIQSAGFEDYAVVGSPSLERSTTASTTLLQRLGGIEGARAASAEQVREVSFSLAGINPPAGQVHTPANLTWYPIVDHDVMDDDFGGWPGDVPVLLGCTQDEARLFVKPKALYAHPETRPEDAYVPETLRAMATALGGSRGEEIASILEARGASAYESIAEVITEGVWHEPALATLQRFDRMGRTAYTYRFARVSPGATRSGLLAEHSAEIAYLFGTMNPQAYDEVDAQVSREVQQGWTEFARTGTPRTVDGTAWPVYREAAPQIAWIGESTSARPLAPTPVGALIAASRTDAATA